MQLVLISHGGSDIRDGERSKFQKLPRLYHAVIHQKLLRGSPHGVAKDLSEIATVDTAYAGNLLDRDIVLKILLDKIDRFLNKLVTHPAAVHRCRSRGGAGEIVQKQMEMSDQVHGGFLGMMDDVVHLLFHQLPQFLGTGMIDGGIE